MVKIPLTEVDVYPELLEQIFQHSCNDKKELWNDIEKEKVGVYKMDGGWVALSVTDSVLSVEFWESDGSGTRLTTEKTIEILRDIARASNRAIVTCYVTRLYSWLVKKHGFVPIGRRGNDIHLMKVFTWAKAQANNPPILPLQRTIPQTTQQPSLPG